MSFARNDDSGIKTIFTYKLQSGGTYDSIITIVNANAPGTFQLQPSSVLTWGGMDQTYVYCDCTMRYVRFYVNYAPDTQDQMVNLALMNPKSNFNFEWASLTFQFALSFSLYQVLFIASISPQIQWQIAIKHSLSLEERTSHNRLRLVPKVILSSVSINISSVRITRS